jgi:site-specific recombinase XerD
MRYVEHFLASRDVSRDYASMLRAHCRKFVEWCGRDIHIDEVDCDTVNLWLTQLKESQLSPYTVDTYRRNLLAVWNDAYLSRVNDHSPLRVKRIKKPRRIVEAYTLSELRQLLVTAARLRGRHRNGNRRSDFWQAMIHAAYSSGLRRSDLLLVFRKDIAEDGTLAVVQHKTGIPLRVRFSQQALQFIARLYCPNGLALPWPYRKDALAPRFKAIRNRAGINRGTLKWIRRAAGSLAEKQHPGDGPRLLGNSPHVFWMHYADRAVTDVQPPTLPPL